MLKEATKKRPGLVSQIHRMHPNLWLPTGEVNPVFASAQKRLRESAGRHAEIADRIHATYPNFCSPTGKVAEARAYVGNGAVSGSLQCEILKKEGCKPESYVLDIGCGALYAGFFLAHYLNEYRFVGMEPNKWLIDAALEQECVQDVMDRKSARFLYRDDFDASSLNTGFDFILSHSILSHAAEWQLDQFLKNTSKVLNPGGKIVASLRLAEGNDLGNSGTVDKKDSKDDHWLYPGNSFFQFDTVVQAAAICGLKAELRPEFTELLTSVNYGEFHDWFVFTRSI
jgi:SAM-dependent methyltransferase